MKKIIASFILISLSAPAFAETTFSTLKEVFVTPSTSAFQTSLIHTPPVSPRIPVEEWEIDNPAQNGLGGKALWTGFDSSHEFGRWSVEGSPSEDLRGIDWFQPTAWQDISFDDNGGAPRFQTQESTHLQIRIEKLIVSKEDCLEWIKNKTNKVEIELKLTLAETSLSKNYSASMYISYVTPQVHTMSITNPDGTLSTFEEETGRMITTIVASRNTSTNSNQLLLETDNFEIPEAVCRTNNGVTVSVVLSGLQTATITSLRFGVKTPF